MKSALGTRYKGDEVLQCVRVYWNSNQLSAFVKQDGKATALYIFLDFSQPTLHVLSKKSHV